MRGGSIPILAWGTVLAVMLAINWIWTGDAIQVGSFGFAVLVVYGFGVLFALSNRDSIRRGPPAHRPRTESLPWASAGALGAGVAIGATLFGLVWARFLVYFGLGLLLLSLGRVALELRAERVSRRAAQRGDRT